MHSLRFVAIIASVTVTGCGLGIARPPPPPAPPQIEPQIPDLPAAPPAGGQGRVILDADGEQAWVSRVTGAMNFEPERTARLDGTVSLGPARIEEPLCVTPCAVDIRQGAHTFVFRSRKDPLRSSTADILLTSNPLFVRHAMGREGHLTGSYAGGAAVLLLGAGAVLFGGAMTTVGAFAEPSRQDDGTMSNPRALVVPGLVTLGAGLTIAAIGAVLMSSNRPVQQPGTTSSWTKPSPAPDRQY
jgi:hypothetical protein